MYWELERKYPKARKQHCCIWCGMPVAIGETYARIKSIYDGDFQDHRFHMECEKQCGDEIDESLDDCFEPWNNFRPHALPLDTEFKRVLKIDGVVAEEPPASFPAVVIYQHITSDGKIYNFQRTVREAKQYLHVDESLTSMVQEYLKGEWY